MGTRIPFSRPDGGTAEGYLAKAGVANAPGVVVIQEWWGLQDQIKGLCDRLALAGYDALAPDLYGGTVVPYHDTDAANREMSSLDFLAATDQLVRGAALYLKRSCPKVGLTGFCLGGAVTMLGAARVGEIAAAVCFYGIPPETAVKPADIKVPLQCHFAERDDWCTPAVVAKFEAGLEAAHKPAEVYRYSADHAFMNEQRAGVHDRKCAELAWERMLAFWGQHLQ
jgi:carboxymethylenebutenolidase